MAEAVSKRRKLEHTTFSGDDADEASFASFGDSDAEDLGLQGENASEDALQENGTEEDGDASGGSQHDDDSEEDSEERIAEGEPKVTVQHRKANSGQQRNARPDRSRSIADTTGAAYAAGTYKSNFFKLQVDELLGQLRPKGGKRQENAESALHSLKKTIEQIPARGPSAVDEAGRQLLHSNKIAVPYPEPRPPPDAKYKLQYAKPTNINVAGSFALQTSCRARDFFEIDMTVTMPKSLFQDKDYLNYRYFYRRAYYLACLAAAIEDAHSASYEVRFRSLHGDALKPILTVTPLQQVTGTSEVKPAAKWRINILPCIHLDTFAQDKLIPIRNCIRAAGKEQSAPTSFYNSSLRADMLVTPYLKLLHDSAKTCPAFRDACLLGGTWLRQRGIGASIADGGFGAFEWSALMACMLQSGGSGGKPLLSQGYSSYQLFKATIQVLAMRDLSKQGLTIGQDAGDVKAVGDGTPLVWDVVRAHNILFKVSPWSYNTLRQEARTTLSMLGDQLFDGFEATFIVRTDSAMLRYDSSVQIPASSLGATGAGSQQATFGCHKLYNVLRRGLGDRIRQVAIKIPSSEAWPLSIARPNVTLEQPVTIGLTVNAETVNRTVDHGPAAEDKSEAASFRQFWGEKAELRRFKDGSIVESLIWSSISGGQSVLEQIIRYLLRKHFGEKAEQDMVLAGDALPKLLGQTDSIAAFSPIMEGYKQLETDIRGLEGLPLSIRQIMPADEQLRYSSTITPLTSRYKRQTPAADVTIQFEGSTRWPDDLVAIQRTKLAFLLKLGESLQEAVDAVSTRIGLENEENDVLNQAHLDIIYDSGVAFRLRIHHDREQSLLERNLKDKSLGPQAKETAALGLAAYKRIHLKAPAHTQAVARLCSRHPALSGTIRLTKKWFAAHLLTNHVAAEVIELMAARTFVRPWPWQAPSSVQTGFLRTLHWLSRWDWRAEPLIVDLSGSGEFKQNEVTAINTRFDAWRKLDPSMNRMVVFAASSVDPDGTTWTDGRPAKVVSGRITALAKAASAEVEQRQLQLEPAVLFVSPPEDFDFVIHLDSVLTGGKKQKHAGSGGTVYKNLELETMNEDGSVGFDPAHDFLQELERSYGFAVVFFSGGRERSVIAGLWSPQTAPRAWKVNLAYSTTPKKAPKVDDVQAEINKEAILAEIARLGGDMIERIQINR